MSEEQDKGRGGKNGEDAGRDDPSVGGSVDPPVDSSVDPSTKDKTATGSGSERGADSASSGDEERVRPGDRRGPASHPELPAPGSGYPQFPADDGAAETRGAPLVLVLNPTAGKGRAARELVHLRTRLLDRGASADVFLTTREGEAGELVERLEMAPGTVVVAAGGDGTVHEVGTALIHRTDVSLAAIPLGSGNDYAGLMGMPAEPVDCLDAIIDGYDTTWDVGMVGGQAFLNTVGFVFSASVSYHSRNTGQLTGMARYGLAIARAFARHRPVLMGFDGLAASGKHRLTLMEIGIGDRCGGGFRLTHRADPADGLLDVCIAKAMSRPRMALLLPKGVKGRHIGDPRVIYEQVPSFRLTLESDTIVHVDGEIRRLEAGEHTVKVIPRALRVRLPQGWTLFGGASSRGAVEEAVGEAASE